MLVRIRSKDGNFRFDLSPTADVSELVTKILETTIDADPTTLAISNQPRGNETLVSTLAGRSLKSLGLKHGDLVFVSYKSLAVNGAPGPSATNGVSTTTIAPAGPDASAKRPWEVVAEDPVDTYWRSRDGMIPRKRDTRFCKHGANAMCDYCMPLESYDPTYHAEHSIKHLSYHAYLRKLTPKTTASSSAALLPPLSPLSYKVKSPCPSGGHPPWPAGICTACQPSAITLQSQPFRMVDHLEIASTDIIDRFLQAWRQTGLQRFGWLIGRYEPYDEVPMGVKAVVEAIHEPPQEGELDGLTLGIPWEDEPRIRELAKSASSPLTIVGYIFTDLVPTPEDRSKSVYKRHPQSFFLSCLEAIFAAHVQNANPISSKSSTTGLFASRLVTAVLTGTEDGAIDISAYQVSEQACAMVEADMIEASVDPGIIRVKEEDRTQDSARYVPDVFFRYKNEYGLEVKKSAKPSFPVEYLLVNVTHGFPQAPTPLFRSAGFKIENRQGFEDQRVETVMSELARLHAPDVRESAYGGNPQQHTALAKFLSDWHLIAFLDTTQLVSPVRRDPLSEMSAAHEYLLMNQDDMKILVRTSSAPNLEDPTVLDELVRTESWQTLMTFARETAAPARPSTSAPSASSHTAMDEDIPSELYDEMARAQADASGGRGSRICPHCTFENTHGGSDCEVCGLPLE